LAFVTCETRRFQALEALCCPVLIEPASSEVCVAQTSARARGGARWWWSWWELEL